MKFLHTGDLHLDSAFSRHGAVGGERLRQQSRGLLKRIFDCAASEQCDMVLMAGDVFDSRLVTPETAALFCRLIRDYARPVIVSPGNHDPYEPGSFWSRKDLPNNLYVFNSREVQCFEFPELNANVFGYAFLSPSETSRLLMGVSLPPSNGMYRLLCAHGDLSDPVSKYAPITEGDLAHCEFSYAALGHIHNRTGSNGRAQYCGFPQGRSFDEEGEGGVILVCLEQEQITMERRVLSEIEFRSEELDVSGVESAEELDRRITEAVEGLGEQKAARTCLRLSLCGMAEEQAVEQILLCGASAREKVAELILKDDTVPGFDGAYLARDLSIRGAFYRTLEPKLKSDNPSERAQALRALQIGLLAIDGKRFTDRSEIGREGGQAQ